MNLAFTVSARREIYEIVSRYAAENRELGVRFVEELDRCLGLLAANPRLGQRVSGTCRRVRLRRFPYTVIYSPEPDGDVIQARVKGTGFIFAGDGDGHRLLHNQSPSPAVSDPV